VSGKKNNPGKFELPGLHPQKGVGWGRMPENTPENTGPPTAAGGLYTLTPSFWKIAKKRRKAKAGKLGGEGTVSAHLKCEKSETPKCVMRKRREAETEASNRWFGAVRGKKKPTQWEKQ